MGGGVPLTRCPSDTNVAARTDGSWWSRVTGDHVDITARDESKLTVGNLTDFVNGNKYLYVNGGIEELYMINKNEQILGLETKLNIGTQNEITVGGKTEITQAFAFEMDKALKYHVCKAGHGVITPHAAIEAARRQRLATTVKTKIASLHETTISKHQIIKDFKTTCGNLDAKIKTNSDQIGTFLLHFGDWRQKGTNITRLVKKEVVEASDFIVESKGDSSVDAPSITLEGGGAKLEIGPILKANGSLTIV